MKASKIACVILASGLSKRFGEADKLTADLCGRPVMSYVLEIARTVGFGEIFCVSRMENVEGITSVRNENPEYGQGHALRLGLGAAQRSEWESCVVLLGDMPLVNASYVKNLIHKYHYNHSVISICESVRMPPALFNSAAIETILSHTTTLGARDIFNSLNHTVLELPTAKAIDVDTPEDLARVARIMKARST